MDAIKEVKKHLSSKFNMKDLGADKFILGIEIKRDQAARKLWLNQTMYIEIVLKRFNIQDCKPVKVLIPVGERLTIEQCPNTWEETKDIARVPYASDVGSLMYMMVCTRADMSHAVGVFRRYM
jgi:hypothetical protein